MKTILLLVRGEARTFYDLEGNCILASMPVKTVLLVDRGNHSGFSNLPGNIELEIVRWSDKAALKQRVSELHQQHHFSAIATLDESNVMLAAELRGQLGLPGMREEQTTLFRDKTRMKQHLQDCGLRVPQFASCTDVDDVHKLLLSSGKIVIKPIDGFGSKQVAFIADPDELIGGMVRGTQHGGGALRSRRVHRRPAVSRQRVGGRGSGTPDSSGCLSARHEQH